MPNHVHGIIVLTKTDSSAPAVGRLVPGSLGAIVRSFKSAATARINQLSNTPGQKVWQRNYYEHVVRSQAELYRIRWYIITNPIRWNCPARRATNVQGRVVGNV